MFYSIRHSTRFRYSDPVRHSVMEVRMQPRSEGNQTVRQFELTTEPRARVFAHRDFLGNIVHHFDVPGIHDNMAIIAEALIELEAPPPLPCALAPSAWEELDDLVHAADFWDFLMPSKFSRPTELLTAYAEELDFVRRDDPLSLVLELNTRVFESFQYVQQVTNVHSPIDEALAARMGVCQDFSHIMIALLRQVGIPARYVSGYLFHRSGTHDRSVADATHAWVEAFLPGPGWVGLDPTNDLIVGERHIRTAVGRDYNDATPTRGTFKGRAGQEMKVAVQVSPAEAPRPEEIEPLSSTAWVTISGPTLGSPEDVDEMVHGQQ